MTLLRWIGWLPSTFEVTEESQYVTSQVHNKNFVSRSTSMHSQMRMIEIHVFRHVLKSFALYLEI